MRLSVCENVFDCYSPLGSMSKRYQHLRSLGTLDISGFNCRSSTIFKFQPCSEATAATCPAHKGDSFRIRNAPNHSVALKRKWLTMRIPIDVHPQAVLVLCHFVPCHLQKPGGHANRDVRYQYKIYLFHIACPEYTSSHDVNNPRTWILSKFLAMRSRVPTAGSMTMLDRKRMGKSKEVWDASSKKKNILWHWWNKWAWDAMTCCAAKRLLYLEVDDANKGWKMLNVGYLRRANVLVACKMHIAIVSAAGYWDSQCNQRCKWNPFVFPMGWSPSSHGQRERHVGLLYSYVYM